MTCSCPCQCRIVGSFGRWLTTDISSQSPSLTVIVGPGTVPLTVMCTLSSPGTRLGNTKFCTTSVKRRTGPGPPVTPSM